MKYPAMAPQPVARPESASTDISAEAEIHREIGNLREYLTAAGLDLTLQPAHADQGSRDRLYWRYGYFVGLKRALAMLTSRGATLH